MATTRHLVDREEVRQWAESHGARPTRVRGTGADSGGLLRLDFPGFSGADTLETIGWDEWLDEFDRSNLALLIQDQTASGAPSTFNKLVRRDGRES